MPSLPAVPVPGPPETKAAWGNVCCRNSLVRPRVLALVPIAAVRVHEATGWVVPTQPAKALNAFALALWPVGVVGRHSGHTRSGLVGGDGHDLDIVIDSLVSHSVGIAWRPARNNQSKKFERN